MKLRNKNTGEVVIFGEGIIDLTKIGCKNLSEMMEAGWVEFEDYEDPRGNWTIDPMNEDYIDDGKYTAPDELERYEELGLKFNTKEEAEKAVEKLKAWKRLKDKGFEFDGLTFSRWGRPCIEYTPGTECIEGVDYLRVDSQVEADLDLLFRGEE